MKNILPAFLLSLVALGLLANCPSTPPAVDVTFTSLPTTLLWSDEFDGPELDAGKWNVEIGVGDQYAPEIAGWGNNEAQYYRKENVYIKDGKLVIEAKKEDFPWGYTSGRITTAGIKLPDGSAKPSRYFAPMSRIEARIKAPKGQGLWPGLCIMGSDLSKYSNERLKKWHNPAWALMKDNSIGWPRCGEIDIFEMNGLLDKQYGATLHYGEWWPHNKWATNDKIHSESLADGWHDYGIIWDSHSAKFTFDGDVWAVVNLESLGEGSYTYRDSFTNPHGYALIFWFAIGGNYLSNQLPPASTWTSAPLEDRCLEVDWIRVYGN
jgi:beta-glucanase (GH16 family)